LFHLAPRYNGAEGKPVEPAFHSPETVAQHFVSAINRHDIDGLAELMSPGHRFIDSLGTKVEGRDTMRRGWAAYFKMVPDYKIVVDETCANGAAVILIGTAQGTYSKDGALVPENRWSTPVALRALIEDSLVAEWRVYADNEPIRKLMAKNS
jgi:ketosteroid isomerase-like protein